ncbi:hypothetical protein [Brevibacillus thermoruber]|uniref:hypothetical protein n=1 Tax=Brevibacillus thermoruber TaxID=33942 RepID=UPI003A5BEF28
MEAAVAAIDAVACGGKPGSKNGHPVLLLPIQPWYTEACRFRDCRHGREPGCAVQAALADGSLERARFDSYRKLQRELAHLARKDDARLQAAEKNKWKKITMAMRHAKPKR